MRVSKKKSDTRPLYFGQYEDDWYYRDLFKVQVKDTTPKIVIAKKATK